MTEQSWISAHVFYHGDTDRLLRGAVQPLVTDLMGTGAVDGYFFLRYWEGGPHLRLRLRVAEGGAHDAVRRLTDARCTEYLRAEPSEPTVTEAEYAVLAPRLAAAEREPTYDPLLRPNNTVEFIRYRPDHRRFGDGEPLRRVEKHLTEASRLALALICGGRTSARRAGDAFAMLLANRALRARSLDELAWHCRFFASGWGGHEVIGTPAFEEHYAARRDELVAVAEAVWAAAHDPGEGPAGTAPAPAVAWLRSAGALRDALVVADGQDDLAAEWTTWVGPDVLGVLDGLVPEMILEQCAHLMCNRLGISPSQEIHLRSLVARAAADLAERN